MSENRESFVLYTKFTKFTDKMTDAQAGVLLKAIFAYTSGREMPEMDDRVDTAFDAIQIDLDRDHARYQQKLERNRANGRKGGRPKKQVQPASTTEEADQIPYQEILDKYNEIIDGQPGLAKATRLSKHRKEKIHARLADGYTVDDLYTVFQKARDSNWMSGRTGRTGTRFDMDWILSPQNFLKIMEGRYDNNASRPPEPPEPPENGYGDYVAGIYADEYI